MKRVPTEEEQVTQLREHVATRVVHYMRESKIARKAQELDVLHDTLVAKRTSYQYPSSRFCQLCHMVRYDPLPNESRCSTCSDPIIACGSVYCPGPPPTPPDHVACTKCADKTRCAPCASVKGACALCGVAFCKRCYEFRVKELRICSTACVLAHANKQTVVE